MRLLRRNTVSVPTGISLVCFLPPGKREFRGMQARTIGRLGASGARMPGGSRDAGRKNSHELAAEHGVRYERRVAD